MLSKAIGTSIRLNTRGVHIDKKCQRYCLDEESINHLLFTCSISLQMWRQTHLPNMVQFIPANNIEVNFKFFLNMQKEINLPKAQKVLPFWIMWRI